MASGRVITCLVLALISFHSTRDALVAAQYRQSYEKRIVPDGQGGEKAQYYYNPYYGPATSDQQVIDLSPQEVYLMYNCAYMTSICANAYRFKEQTARGKRLHDGLEELDNGGEIMTFGYDLNTAKVSRRTDRRDHSCPGTWKDGHKCPEFDQKPIWRHDTEWWTTATESGVNTLQHLRAGGTVVAESKIMYTCDEFPAASFVEGGDGLDQKSPSETRCAAARCTKGVKAEQNWQGTAHQNLGNELKRIVGERRRLNSAEFSNYKALESVIFFKFLMYREENSGIAAQVISYPYQTINGKIRTITQAKRDVNVSNSTEPEWQANILYDRLMALAEAGYADRHVPVHANDSLATMQTLVPPGMPQMSSISRARRWGLEDQRARPQPPALVPKSELPLAPVAPLLRRASSASLDSARSIVERAIAKSTKRNEARYANPRRKNYRLRPGTIVGQSVVERRDVLRQDEASDAPALLEITDEIAQAAALVAEAEAVAAAGFQNQTLPGNFTGIHGIGRRQTAGTFWMASIARKGKVPWGNNSTYAVFRNVRDYGATGNGVTDDTAAIKRALMDGKRCADKCNGSTTKNAIVYFPPGTYLISTTIPLPFGTQVIGDALNRPILKAAASFVGLGAILSTDEYTGGGTGPDGGDQQWYINTANFYRQLRNVIIDIRAAPAGQKNACLHYQVAQATSLQNVELIAGPTQTGMVAENGSGGQISDVTFTGGAFGLWGGEQQFTSQRLKFSGCTVGVQVIWDWGWVWKSVVMNNVGTGFKLIPEAGSTGKIGSATILDSSFTGVTNAIVISPPSSTPGSGTTGLVIENVAFSGVTNAVSDASGKSLLPGGTKKVDHWALGPVYSGSATARNFSMGAKIGNYRRSSTLINENGAYFERPKPQYEDVPVSSFLHVRDFGATGDGATDDTAAFQKALYASQGKILFVDAGSYILTSTVTVPTGSKIVGEAWSQLVASGSYFSDANKPQVLLKVGLAGQIGDVEMQDLIITTKGPTAGAILIEWNMRASGKGSAGLWDCHVRIGGATGTKLTPAECPALTTGVAQGCNAASLMMHITPSASGYFENMWLWVADHMIDDPNLNDANNTMVQNSVYAARGLLVESRQPVWLYGTSSEHAVYYQYNFHKAKNVFAGMIQTESPYYQPTPPPPAPFASAVGLLPGDPSYKCAAGDEFSGCDQSWAVIIRQSESIAIAAAGLYSWFSTYTQACIDARTCQKALVLLDNNSASVRIQHLITIGAKYMVVMNGKGITAAANANVNTHPSWSQISVLDVASSGVQFDDLIWVDPKIWYMDQPEFTCVPPCHVQLPPWSGATSTINYPLLTVSDGTWTSTITKPPLTVSQWVFEVVTLTQGANQKRQEFNDFYPKPATMTSWPAVVYTGPNGSPTTLAPSVTFPKPPATIGPNATPPPKGAWPAHPIRPRIGLVNSPVVDECAFMDDKCLTNPVKYGGMGEGGDTMAGDGDSDDDDENWNLETTYCGASPTKPVIPPPQPSPAEIGIPQKNTVECYNGGETASHADLDRLISDFCGEINQFALWQNNNGVSEGFSLNRKWPVGLSGNRGGPVEIWFIMNKGCKWDITGNDCSRYLHVAVDACDCSGVDNKHGGIVRNNCMYWRIDPNTFW